MGGFAKYLKDTCKTPQRPDVVKNKYRNIGRGFGTEPVEVTDADIKALRAGMLWTIDVMSEYEVIVSFKDA